MPAFVESIEIEAPAATAWSIVGDLAGVARFVPGIRRVQVDGEARVCTFEDGRVQHERVSEYSERDRSYRYSIEDAPGMARNHGRFAVEELGARSRVVWEASFEALDPATAEQLASMWRGAMHVVLGNLKRLAEA